MAVRITKGGLQSYKPYNPITNPSGSTSTGGVKSTIKPVSVNQGRKGMGEFSGVVEKLTVNPATKQETLVEKNIVFKNKSIATLTPAMIKSLDLPSGQSVKLNMPGEQLIIGPEGITSLKSNKLPLNTKAGFEQYASQFADLRQSVRPMTPKEALKNVISQGLNTFALTSGKNLWQRIKDIRAFSSNLRDLDDALTIQFESTRTKGNLEQAQKNAKNLNKILNIGIDALLLIELGGTSVSSKAINEIARTNFGRETLKIIERNPKIDIEALSYSEKLTAFKKSLKNNFIKVYKSTTEIKPSFNQIRNLENKIDSRINGILASRSERGINSLSNKLDEVIESRNKLISISKKIKPSTKVTEVINIPRLEYNANLNKFKETLVNKLKQEYKLRFPGFKPSLNQIRNLEVQIDKRLSNILVNRSKLQNRNLTNQLEKLINSKKVSNKKVGKLVNLFKRNISIKRPVQVKQIIDIKRLEYNANLNKFKETLVNKLKQEYKLRFPGFKPSLNQIRNLEVQIDKRLSNILVNRSKLQNRNLTNQLEKLINSKKVSNKKVGKLVNLFKRNISIKRPVQVKQIIDIKRLEYNANLNKFKETLVNKLKQEYKLRFPGFKPSLNQIRNLEVQIDKRLSNILVNRSKLQNRNLTNQLEKLINSKKVSNKKVGKLVNLFKRNISIKRPVQVKQITLVEKSNVIKPLLNNNNIQRLEVKFEKNAPINKININNGKMKMLYKTKNRKINHQKEIIIKIPNSSKEKLINLNEKIIRVGLQLTKLKPKSRLSKNKFTQLNRLKNKSAIILTNVLINAPTFKKIKSGKLLKGKTNSNKMLFRQISGTITKTINKNAYSNLNQFKQLQKEGTAQKYSQKQRPIQRSKYKFKQKYPTKIKIKLPNKQRRRIINQRNIGYNVYGKSRRRFIKLNIKPLRKQDALSRGKYAIDHTTSKTLKIQPIGKVRNFGSIKNFEKGYNKNEGYKFRTNRIKRGRRIPLRNTYIEKRKYGIDTRGEKRQLSLARFIRQKGLIKRKAVRKNISHRKIRRSKYSRRINRIISKNINKKNPIVRKINKRRNIKRPKGILNHHSNGGILNSRGGIFG